jgi:hypothetical protein
MSDNPSSRRIDPSIVAALIGVLGTIAVTLISIKANQAPTPPKEPTAIVISTATLPATAAPTDTVPPNAPTSTPEPPTDTPVPTFTLVPPVPIGQDWGASCISNLWKPYPDNVPTIDKGNGCWQNPVIIFSAANGSMGFLYERGGSGAVEYYGLFAPLPVESGTVTFKVRLDDLSNVDLWMGIFAGPDINSQGLLMTIPAGNVRKRVIVQKDIPTYETIQSTQNLDQGDGYSITFTFTANSASGTVNPNVFVTNPVSIPSAQKWLFLGYKGLKGSYRIEGNFSGLEVK